MKVHDSTKVTTKNTTKVGSIFIDKDAFDDNSIQIQEDNITSKQDLGMSILEQDEDEEEKRQSQLVLNMVKLGRNWKPE